MSKRKRSEKEKHSRGRESEREPDGAPVRMRRKEFDRELRILQTELCHLQRWVVDKGLRVAVVFEGRDAAGKGGVIRRITERVSPRVFRVVALPAPSDREKTQLYIQRYLPHFPAAGEVILFDRSWYNRAGVERVMGFCDESEYQRFLALCPLFEEHVVQSGILLVKYFFDVGPKEQLRRFQARIGDPMRHWKLSPMDVESWRSWWEYTRAYARMLDATDTPAAPWYRVPADDKRRARLNCIAHLLSMVPYEKQPFTPPKLGKRRRRKPSTPESLDFEHQVPQLY